MGQARTNKVQITGSYYFDLEDVRWLVDQSRTEPNDAKVTVTYYAGDAREGTSSTLSITLED